MATIVPSPAILETERLYIRELSPEKYEHLFTNCTDKEISTYFAFKTAKELNEAKENFKKGFVTYFVSFMKFHLIDKYTGEIIGDCDFHTWIPTHRRAELGYKLYSDENKRKGFMKEALGAVLEYGFKHMNLYRIEALIADYNTPSKKLLLHYGFQREGVIRGHYIVDGINEDSVMLSLLLPEYQQLILAKEGK